ncbi:MAG: dTDP-4-amino-4,6-dideoxygalactose transaminase, partial [Pseudomonadota bacterium]
MISIENKLADIRKARQSSAAPAKCGRIPFNKPSLVGEEINNIFEAIELGQLSGDGHFTDLCNQEIARITDASTALLTHSCTAALEMAAILCELGPGDEVIMPSFTFVSTANAVVLRGAVPVFVDIDPMTLNIDPAKVEAAVTPATRAIFAVHYAGFPADMDALARIARENDLVLVEDAAQALGSFYKGRPAGSLADIGAISFHETKNIISGEGGAITINRPDFMKRAEIIREKGTNRSQFIRGEIDKYSWVDLGSSMLPGELIAAFLFGQLSRTDAIIDRRRAIFDTYMASFADLEASGRLRCPKWSEECVGNGHMFYLLLDNAEDRQAFIRYLGSRGITAPFHYVP